MFLNFFFQKFWLLPCPRFFPLANLVFFFSVFFSPPNFRLEFHLFSQQQNKSHLSVAVLVHVYSSVFPSNLTRNWSIHSGTLLKTNKKSFRPCEVRVQSIEYCGKEMGSGSGVAFIRSTAGRYTATACATSASSSTWPMPCHRLCLSISTLQPLISMLTVSLCHSCHTFLPPLPFRALCPT